MSTVCCDYAEDTPDLVMRDTYNTTLAGYFVKRFFCFLFVLCCGFVEYVVPRMCDSCHVLDHSIENDVRFLLRWAVLGCVFCAVLCCTHAGTGWDETCTAEAYDAMLSCLAMLLCVCTTPA